MVIGHHTSICFNCGTHFMTGDCIDSFCNESCEQEWEDKNKEIFEIEVGNKSKEEVEEIMRKLKREMKSD